MAPFSFMTATVSCLAKSFTFCSSYLTRCTCVLPAPYTTAVKNLSSLPSGPPKRPLNGYMRYVLQQQPMVSKQFPDTKTVDIMRKIAQQWRMLSPEQKQPFEEASLQAREQFKVDLQHYREQLTPAQLQQQSAEKRLKMAQRKANRKKRELTSLGKPKRPRSPFNIFMSENFAEARGSSTQGKMKSLLEDWKNLLGHQKQAYKQLAEDDKIRYKNEIKSWEEHMLEIGREDLIREQTLSTQKNAALKRSPAMKKTKKAKTMVAKTTAKRNLKTPKKMNK
ncbi:hypothetical protein fugu_000579 [Takifugu bimaculatus]|uniref:Transcription factor A, mitochondrial n=1 Tax=Takifugu bimaculatus TaxID=433685 RepID=A0A4Z2CHG2_9TELE|nr:hypothetical protein fugu_000579 [Takifugu bimaculatus]